MRERLTILVIAESSMDEHSLRSQVGTGSELDCLFGQLHRLLWILDSEAGVVKTWEIWGSSRRRG